MTVIDLQESKKEAKFHADRLTCIGGSDIAAIMGLSQWSSAMTVYNRLKGLDPGPVQSEAMFWGIKYEPVIAEVYSERTGREVEEAPHKRHPDYNWIGCHVDRLVVGQPGILEIKTAGEYVSDEFGTEGSDDIPEMYLMQGQWNMEIWDREWCDYPINIGGNRMPIYRALRSREIFKVAFDVANDFYHNNVLKSIPPDPDGSEACKEAMQILYPKDSGREKVCSNPLVDKAVTDHIELKTEEKRIKSELLVARNIIVAEIGEAAIMTGPGYKVTFKKSKDGEKLDSKRLMADNPTLASVYMIDVPGSRKLLPKAVK